MHKTKKQIPRILIWGEKKIPNFLHFFRPIFFIFNQNFLIFTSISSFFLILSSFSSICLSFRHFLFIFFNFFSSFPHFFLASFFPLNFPQFPQKYFPIFNFFPRIQILGSNTFCNSDLRGVIFRLIFIGPMKGEWWILIYLMCFFSTKTMGIMKIHFGHRLGKYDP